MIRRLGDGPTFEPSSHAMLETLANQDRRHSYDRIAQGSAITLDWQHLSSEASYAASWKYVLPTPNITWIYYSLQIL